MSDSCLLPEFDAAQAATLARELYALEGPMKRLHGERDLNFLVSCGFDGANVRVLTARL